MNVLEAYAKLEELNKKQDLLYKAVAKLEDDYDAVARDIVDMMVDLKAQYQKEAEELKLRLEKTQLVNLPNVR